MDIIKLALVAAVIVIGYQFSKENKTIVKRFEKIENKIDSLQFVKPDTLLLSK